MECWAMRYLCFDGVFAFLCDYFQRDFSLRKDCLDNRFFCQVAFCRSPISEVQLAIVSTVKRACWSDQCSWVLASSFVQAADDVHAKRFTIGQNLVLYRIVQTFDGMNQVGTDSHLASYLELWNFEWTDSIGCNVHPECAFHLDCDHSAPIMRVAMDGCCYILNQFWLEVPKRLNPRNSLDALANCCSQVLSHY